MWEFGNFVDGKWMVEEVGESIDVINPADETIVGRVTEASHDVTQRAIRAARSAFDEGPWPWLTVTERAAYVKRFADALSSRREEIVRLLTAQCGVVKSLLPVQVDEGLNAGHYCADWVARDVDWEQVSLGGRSPVAGHVVVREPVGVVAAITPFNYPFLLDMWKVAPALAVGCSVILKPHPWTPLQSFLIAQAAEEAGIPKGVLNIVVGGPDIGDELTGSPLVDKITFTGSTKVGKHILRRAADTVKRVHLELGGKSAQIVLPDVPEEYVHQMGIDRALRHCGQTCGLMSRLLLHESQVEAYVEGAAASAQRTKIGDPSDPTVDLGPLIREQQRLRVEGYVQSGIEEGATLEFGGKQPADLKSGFFYEPTLFTNVNNKMRIAQEEIFGPVLCVIAYQSIAEAIEIANDSPYGLSGMVVGATVSAAFNVARQIRTGNVQAAVAGSGGQGATAEIPDPGKGRGPGWGGERPRGQASKAWGGFKESGIGREWGHHGLEEFTEIKVITWE